MPEAPSFSGDALARRRSFLSWGRAEEEGGRETCEKRTRPLADEGFPSKPDQSDSKLEITVVRGENLPNKHKGRLVPGTGTFLKILNFTEEYFYTFESFILFFTLIY